MIIDNNISSKNNNQVIINNNINNLSLKITSDDLK